MWLLVLAACQGPPAQGEVLALTYNVAGLPQGISGSDPERNIPLIGPLLDGYGLALVQEDFAYHDELAAGASHPYRSATDDETERFMGDGLNRFSQWPLDPVERIQWHACNGTLDGASDCLAEKGFSAGGVYLAPDLPLLVVNHHADAGGGDADIAARADNFAQLAAWIDAAGDRAVLVAGDTNLRDTRPDDVDVLQSFLDAAGLTDACAALSCGEAHIDRFLFRDGADLALEPREWFVAEEFVDDDGDALSDHPAIGLRLGWSEPR